MRGEEVGKGFRVQAVHARVVCHDGHERVVEIRTCGIGEIPPVVLLSVRVHHRNGFAFKPLAHELFGFRRRRKQSDACVGVSLRLLLVADVGGDGDVVPPHGVAPSRRGVLQEHHVRVQENHGRVLLQELERGVHFAPAQRRV